MKITSITMAGRGTDSETLVRCIKSLLWCDWVYILDTGLDPDVLKAAREVCTRDCMYSFTLWSGDFGDMRNKALKAAEHTGCQWALMIDSDEVAVCSDPGAFRRRLEASHAETVTIDHADHSYSLPRVFRLPAKVKHVGRTHEAAYYHNLPSEHAPELQFQGFAKTPEQLIHKFTRDLDALKLMVKEDPTNGRWWYYLGETYRNLGQPKQAENSYLQCTHISQWDEERAWSCYLLATLQGNRGAHQEAIRSCLTGLTHRPDFPELPWLACENAWKAGQWAWAVHYGEMARYMKPRIRRIGFQNPSQAVSGSKILDEALKKLGW